MIPRFRSLVLVSFAALLLHTGATAQAPAPEPARPEAAPAAKAPAKATKPTLVRPQSFAAPEQATQTLVAALRAGDGKALLRIFGSEGRTLIASGDPVSDRQSRQKFVQAYDAGHRLVTDGDKATLVIGADDWPFPIPLVKGGERWQFDARQGREEIVARRIGRNELYTIETCLAYVDAQREYYAEDRNGDGILEYAQRIASSPGQRDGLYWATRPGEPSSPLGELVVRAWSQGYRRAKSGGPTPYHGYLYRILTAQGPGAPDGEYDYVVRGHMIAGFALVAFPARYGVSGVMTFLVNHDGVVYQKDLGPGTRAAAFALQKFNPDATWTKADVPTVKLTSN